MKTKIRFVLSLVALLFMLQVAKSSAAAQALDQAGMKNPNLIAVMIRQERRDDGKLTGLLAVEVASCKGEYPVKDLAIKALTLSQKQPFQSESAFFIGTVSLPELLERLNKTNDVVTRLKPLSFELNLTELIWNDGLSAVRNPETARRLSELRPGPFRLVVSVSLKVDERVMNIDSNELEIVAFE